MRVRESRPFYYEHRRAVRWTALNYASHYPFSRSKARSQQQASSHTTKIKNQVCCCCCATTKRRALVSGHDSLGQPCFHGQERRGVSVACSFQMSGSIVSTGSLQQRFVAKISHKRTLWPCTSGPYRRSSHDLVPSKQERCRSTFFLVSRVECFHKKLEPRRCIRVSSLARKIHARLVHAGCLKVKEG